MPEHKGQDAENQKKKMSREEQNRPGQAEAQQQSQHTSNGGNGGGGHDVSGQDTVHSRRRRYLVALRNTPGLQPANLNLMGYPGLTEHQVEEELNKFGGKIIKEIKPSKSFGLLSNSAASFALPKIISAELDVEKGEELRLKASPNVIIEHDAVLRPLDETFSARMMRSMVAAAISPVATTAATEIAVRVMGEDDRPLSGALVTIYGSSHPAQGTTDGNGYAVLTVVGSGPNSTAALYVKPQADYWEKFIVRPDLKAGQENTVILRRLDSSYPELQNGVHTGWGQKIMGLGMLANKLTGRGVKIGIIDSGCDNTHPQLQHVRHGVDLTSDKPDPNGWTYDEISHGTHCAGIIGAQTDGNLAGIRGFAPEAEIYAYKVFPGGRFSSLIEALDLCIEQGIDIVNLSLGSDETSELVARKIMEARSQGVACIVAAGNTGGPLMFPANVPGVMAVSAIGQQGTYPYDTYHAQTHDPRLAGSDGIFSARFSCYGPEVDLCAPGVAIVSCVAGGGYAAWDGTSMAAPHVTGLAALMLAHHPLFTGELKSRSTQRVAALFKLIQSSAVPYFVDAQRGGVGVPTVQPLLGLETPALAGQAQQMRTGAPQTFRDSAAMRPAPTGAIAAAQPGYGYAPWQQAPVASPPPAQNALAWAMSNPAALQIISHMRAAGLL